MDLGTRRSVVIEFVSCDFETVSGLLKVNTFRTIILTIMVSEDCAVGDCFGAVGEN